jgi:hypothetical protein
MIVEGYRALHDFSFPEASLFSKEWKALAQKQDNIEHYHLAVQWELVE